MKRNLSLENSIVPSFYRNLDHHQQHHRRIDDQGESRTTESSQQSERQQLTIFYNGTVCVYHVSHFQARAILMVAREMEERLRKSPSGTLTGPPVSPQTMCLSPPNLSIKRSLQSFLHKRKHRL